MIRRLLVAAAAALALTLLVIPGASPAGAQVCPSDSPGCEDILPDETEVLPDVDTPDQSPSVDVGGNTDPQVLGATTSRSGALPFTGGSVGAAAVVGIGLTAAGIAFAATARRRRSRLETV